HVHDPDLLRVRGPQQPGDRGALDALPDGPRPRHDRLRCDGCHECLLWLVTGGAGRSWGYPAVPRTQNSPFPAVTLPRGTAPAGTPMARVMGRAVASF